MEIKRCNRQKIYNSVKAENVFSFILYTGNPENVFYGKEYSYKDSISINSGSFSDLMSEQFPALLEPYSVK